VRWNLIGHSQGGLIIVLASKLAESPREFASLVGRAVLVGAPLAGTVRALDAILFGRADLGKKNIPGLLAAARTWPALYQMLPAWPAAVNQDGNPFPPEQQFIWPAGWGPLISQGIQEDLLLRARETQALLMGPYSHLAPGVDTLTIMGKRQNTPIAVPKRGGHFVQDYKNQKGDSLVPEAITSGHIGTPVFDRRKSFTGKVEAHSMLCIDPDVQQQIENFFVQPLQPIPAA